LSIAAHAHADALSVELRHGGVEILVDPGTYCYHGEEAFRRYFRSTIGHNTVELGGTDQSLSGGPFMWLRHARTTGPELAYDPDGNISRWSASHNGYESLGSCGTHRRTVSLEQAERRLEISDEISSSGPLAARMAFHLGPRVSCRLETNCARLSWVGSDGREYSAIMELPMELSWSVHRGELEPMLGWYSSSFGRIEPTTVVMGERARAKGKMELHTSIQFEEPAGVARSVPE
jgi:hypothetical protein